MLAFHGIFTAYGFWLPNDPRGSWSDWVASWELFCRGGRATKVNVRHSVAHVDHDARQRLAVKSALRRRPVQFTGIQARAIGRGFANAIRKSGHRILACAVLPEHVHVVVRASRYKPKRIIGHLKRDASLALRSELLHPFQHDRSSQGLLPSCWAENSWCVYLDGDADVHRAIQYVESNPEKEGKRWQCWSFVEAFI
jgi:REP element-mobilizing transposase RayT